MIVPSSRLLYWTGGAAIPLSLLAAAWPDLILPFAAGFALLFASVILDALLSRNNLHSVLVTPQKEVRLTRGREGHIQITLVRKRGSASGITLGIGFPPEIHAADRELRIDLPQKDHPVSLNWPCKPLKGGDYRLETVHLETPSPLGFWAVREPMPFRVDLRVYPNLMSERKHLSALFLARGGVGIRPKRRLGDGREFEKLREYVPGDAFDRIHWKTTAKSGRPVSKVYQIEKTQEVYVVIDMSRLSARPVLPIENRSPGDIESPREYPPMLLDRFVTAGLILGLAAQKQGDLFGLVTFNDRVRNFVRARNGKAHYNACREALYRAEPTIVSPDYEEVFSFIGSRLRKRALLVFLTSLDNPALADLFIKGTALLRKKHLVLVQMLRPEGAGPLFSGAEKKKTDDLYAALGGHILWSGLKTVENRLGNLGISFNLLENEFFCAETVSRYQEFKQRQLL